MFLSTIFSILIIGIAAMFFVDSKNIKRLRFIALSTSSLVLILSCLLLNGFDSNLYFFQYYVTYNLGSDLLNMVYSFGLDNISVFFFVLSSLLIFVCILFIWNDKLFKEYGIALLVIELFLLVIFSVLDLFLFYIFFEAILIPMYLLIGIWGSRERKIRAVYLFFFYTLCGSIMLLIGILYIYSVVGTLNLEYLLSYQFTKIEQSLLWFCFFFYLLHQKSLCIHFIFDYQKRMLKHPQ